jgi:hypothetical protein
MTDNTPTTEEVRTDYAYHRYYCDGDVTPSEAHAEFDRFLAARDAQVAARALEEAAQQWEAMVLKEKPPVRGYLFLRSRAAEIRKAAEQ